VGISIAGTKYDAAVGIEKVKDFQSVAPGNEEEYDGTQHGEVSFDGGGKGGAAKTDIESVNSSRKNQDDDRSPYQPPLHEVIEREVEDIKGYISPKQGLSDVEIGCVAEA